MSFISKAQGPARLQGLFTQKICGFLGAEEEMYDPIC